MAELRHLKAGELSGNTAQSSGMTRLEAISGNAVGAQALWMGETRMAPATHSADHHHGHSETAIYVVSGSPEFVFLDQNGAERRIKAKPGDYVYVPPHTPHREENNDQHNEAVVVIARTTQEAIVVNLPSLSGG
jgi:uncharacterized RmlC-like cupin family protein